MHLRLHCICMLAQNSGQTPLQKRLRWSSQFPTYEDRSTNWDVPLLSIYFSQLPHTNLSYPWVKRLLMQMHERALYLQVKFEAQQESSNSPAIAIGMLLNNALAWARTCLSVEVQLRVLMTALQCVVMQTSVVDSTISMNNAQAYWGGGVALLGNTTLHVLSSSVSWNIAPSGGGLYTQGNAMSNFSNTTVSGNAATQYGGGLYMCDFAQVSAGTKYWTTDM